MQAHDTVSDTGHNPCPPSEDERVPTPAEQVIQGTRGRIDEIDNQIIELIGRRKKLSSEIQSARLGAGGTKISYGRENVVIGRYSRELGKPGRALSMAILEVCRGALDTAARRPADS
ncbi:chorismate mutase [Amycolatopsis sp. YIM 10]|uniref:chorismate mutase n=1 Tax=Amycolatopsis sp. YIM 10 TaxID=2653857 RepID=UPI0012905ED7|nr:chorismate mutase [Amycolatopsis sp. YIM 10]QFU89910.1 Intracellular chorismate mutase [Amycolatopsis sp. YIM 10]